MKTDDRITRQRDETGADEAKVVRLSDWLGPEDELVPFGPRAHAGTATPGSAEGGADSDPGAEPPGAAGFWDGDTSMHAAVPGPGMFEEPSGPDSHKRAARVWRLALPHPLEWCSRAYEDLADLLDRISWRQAAAGVAIVTSALIVLAIALGHSAPGHRDMSAHAGIGEPGEVTVSGTLGEVGAASRTAAVSGLRQLPPVNTADRTIGAAAQHAQALKARQRPPTAVAPASIPSSSTTGSVETTTAAPATAETTSAPSETEPTETPSSPPPTTGGGSTGSGGGSNGGGGSNSGSQKQSAFGTGAGALGPGSSPNG